MQFPLFDPEPAHSIEATGLTRAMVLDLMLKHVFIEGTTSLQRLAAQTKIDYTILHSLFRHLQKEQLCDTKGMVEEDYEFALTSRGRSMAEDAYKKNSYAGPAPVPLEQYKEAVRLQAVEPSVTKQSLSVIFSDLVIADTLITDLGSAIMSGGVIFLYGPTGNGKTSIAERLPGIFKDLVYIPYAVEVSGHIVKVFDGVLHHQHENVQENTDPRWVLCRRPVVSVGGELRSDMLETSLDEVTRICVGPIQMKANNGILIIDDFGRQRITPRELLNRWIVPLDRRVDQLSLWSGVTFEMPFELLVVMATNLNLSDLAEDAFIRRLKNKIKIDAINPDAFIKIMQRVCRDKDVECRLEMAAYTLNQCEKHALDGLRACFPRDIVGILCGVAAFEQRTPTLDEQNIDRALRLYFVH